MRWFKKRFSVEVTYTDWKGKVKVTRTSFNVITGVLKYVVRLPNGDRVEIKLK